MAKTQRGARARAQEHALGLGALRSLLRAVRRDGRRRVRLPLARLSDAVWITRLGRRAAGPAPRGEGSLRHGRGSDDVRLGRVRRPRPRRRLLVGRRARVARLGERRQDEPARVRVRRHVAEPALRRRPEPAFPGADGGRVVAAARRRRSSSGSPTRRSAPTRAARSAFRLRAAGSSGFKPTYGLVPIDGVFPLAPRFDHAGPMAATSRLHRAVRRSLRARRFRMCRRADVRSRRARGARVRGEPIEFPTAEAVVPAFMREVGDVHRELYAENGELYGENIRGKVERCIAVTDASTRPRPVRATSCASGRRTALDGFDLLLTPMLSCPVPPADCDEIEVRRR